MRPTPGPYYSGKVRELYPVPLRSNDVHDLYSVAGRRCLLVTTDELDLPVSGVHATFDGRGVAITMLTRFWAQHPALGSLRTNVVTEPVELPTWADPLALRAVVVRRVDRVHPVAWNVFTHLVGELWQEYFSHGTINGEPAEPGLQQYQRLPEPLAMPILWDSETQTDVALAPTAALVDEASLEVRDKCVRAQMRATAFAEERGVKRSTQPSRLPTNMACSFAGQQRSRRSMASGPTFRTG
jgi:phosphoribosylaminoimidazole-succinocarboxamide synthase